MRNFCTLFDKNYLYKGLTLYFSLLKNSSEFHLWILCMDDLTFNLLKKVDLEKTTLITIAEFENERLLEVKKKRTVAEYSWTATANLCWHLLDKIQPGDMITYLDADTFFFFSPEEIFREIGDASVAIVEHRLEGEMKKLEKFVGKYNVGWVSFRNDENGKQVCEWWKDRVLEWCYAHFEGGKIGDQHYLNDWTERFSGVHVILHPGADVAPWNVNNEQITAQNGKVMIGDVPLVFYHFHNFILINESFFLTASAYHINRTAKKIIYGEYIERIKEVIGLIKKIEPSFNYGFKKNFIKSLFAQLCFNFKFFNSLYIQYSFHNLKKSYDKKN